MVDSIVRLMSKDEDDKSEESSDSPNLFNNFNISSFNVSFNAGKHMNKSSSGEGTTKKKSTVLQRRVNSRHESRFVNIFKIL